MPLYDYKCTQCGKTTEIRRGFDEAHTEACPSCGGKLARVFNPAPIVFKGSGFYVTDSRKSSGASSSTAAPTESKPAADNKPAEPAKTESAPAAAKTEAPKPKASEPAA
jgi:putative FmdB family regulatory protein